MRSCCHKFSLLVMQQLDVVVMLWMGEGSAMQLGRLDVKVKQTIQTVSLAWELYL